MKKEKKPPSELRAQLFNAPTVASFIEANAEAMYVPGFAKYINSQLDNRHENNA